MDWEESGRRSPSLELIDRPPSLYRPPIRSPASPRLSTQEVDELTNPNLPYRTGYTYAFSKSYRNSTDYDDYEVPNMAGTSFYHDSSMRDDDGGHSSSFASTIYEEVITVYYKTITAIYCSLATTYTGGRSIVEWIYYILYSIAYGVWYAGSHGGRWIGDAIYRVLYSIAYGVWLVLDSTGRVSYNGSSLLLQTLFDIVMFVPRKVSGFINGPPTNKRVTYNEDDNEVRYFTQNERIVIGNGPSASSSSSSAYSSSFSTQKSVFGGLWTAVMKYLKRGRRSHMEKVYELRSRTIEREVGDDTDTDDELGIDEHMNVVRQQPLQSVPQRRTRAVRQLDEDDVISDESSSNILINLLYLPIDGLVALYHLLCYTITSVGSGVSNVGYYSFHGTKSVFETIFEGFMAVLYYTIYFPLATVGSFVSNVASGSISSSPANGVPLTKATKSRSHVVHRTTALGSATTDEDVAAVPVYSSHNRDEEEDILAELRDTPVIKRRSRRLSNSSNTSDRSATVSNVPSTSTARTTRAARIVKVPLIHSSSSQSTSSSSSLFAPVGGIVWAVKDSTTTILAKIIDCVHFTFLLIFECFRAIGQLIGGGASAIVSSVGSLLGAVASGTATGSTGLLSMIGSVITTIFTVFRDVLVESANVVSSTGKAIGAGVGSIWGSRPSGSTLWNLLLWLLILLPLIFFALWLLALPPFKKEHDEVVAEYVKHYSSIMEDYYSYGQHHTKSFIGVIVDTIGAGARSIWVIFASLRQWMWAAIFGLWESLLMFLAGLRIDRLFAPSPTPAIIPPPIIPPPIIAPSSGECPPAPTVYVPAPAPPPVYIPAPAPTVDQEALIAAIVAKVTAQMEQKMSDSLNGKVHILEESVRRAEEELRAKITVTHEPIDYTNLDAMIAAAIRKYDSDKTGLVDYALESAGGMIISTRCSETYALSTRVEKIFDIPLYYSNYGPRVVIQRNSQALVPGECWAFKGGIGYLTIKLAVPIKVTSVSYEHIPKSISRNGENLSAPRTFTIFTYEKDEYDFASRFELGKFTYDAHGDPLQFFPVQEQPPYPVQIIEFQVDSNYGEVYTCLYRFRVHGDNLALTVDPK